VFRRFARLLQAIDNGNQVGMGLCVSNGLCVCRFMRLVGKVLPHRCGINIVFQRRIYVAMPVCFLNTVSNMGSTFQTAWLTWSLWNIHATYKCTHERSI